MEDKSARMPKSHKLTISNRKAGAITGVVDVIAFDVKEVLLETELGMLQIKGENLHVSRLSVEKGEVDLDGTIDSITYSALESFGKKKESLMGRLFK